MMSEKIPPTVTQMYLEWEKLRTENQRLRDALAEISELKSTASVDDAIEIANDALDASA